MHRIISRRLGLTPSVSSSLPRTQYHYLNPSLISNSYRLCSSHTKQPSPSLHHSTSSTTSHSSSPTSTSSQPTQSTPGGPREFSIMSGNSHKKVSEFLKQSHDRIFENNRAWTNKQREEDPEFFEKLSSGQAPDYLYIGCSDSRVPANQIMGLSAGEVFVHRNIANLVPNTDLNVMSVIEYAVVHLHVKHIIVCGHYACGGVGAAMSHSDMGLLNPWLRNIRDVYRLYETELDAIEDKELKNRRLVELNVIEQCRNVIKTAAVQQQWQKNGYPVVHGWVFDLKDGLLKDLKVDFETVLGSIKKIYNLGGDKK